MNVYIVFNEALRDDSSYFDIVDVFDSQEKAIACMRTCCDDFVKACDDNEPEGFKEYKVESNTGFDGNVIEMIVLDSNNPSFFESWFIDEYKVH